MSLTQSRLLSIIAAANAYRQAYESIATAHEEAQRAGEGTQAYKDLLFAATCQIPSQRLDLAPSTRLLDTEVDRLQLRAGKARRERNRLARRKAEREGDYLWQPQGPTTSPTLDDASLAKCAADMGIEFNAEASVVIPDNAPSFDPNDAKPFTPPDIGFLKSTRK